MLRPELHDRRRNLARSVLLRGAALAVAAMALALVGSFAEGAHLGSTVFVDASFVGDEQGSETNPFDTIQEGIAHANSGDIVQVAAGSYSGTVTIAKSLNLRGAQAGVDARSRSGLESSAECIEVTPASVAGLDVTIDGFSVSSGSCGIRITSDLSGTQQVSILNNIVSGFTVGIGAEGVTESAQLLVSQNVSSGSLDGIIVADGDISGSTQVTIQDNAVTNNTCVGIWLDTSVLGTATVSITGNSITGTTQTGCPSFEPAGMGVYVRDIGSGADSPMVTISGNTITNSVDQGIRIDDTASGTTHISDNGITGSGANGIDFVNGISGGTVDIDGNTISGTTGATGYGCGVLVSPIDSSSVAQRGATLNYTNNISFGNDDCAIEWEGEISDSTILVDGNNISGEFEGVDFDDAIFETNVTITNNVIASSDFPIYLEEVNDSTLTIDGNTVTASGSESIRVGDISSSTVSVSSNTISGAGSEAITISGLSSSSLTMSGGSISRPDNDGIELGDIDDSTVNVSSISISGSLTGDGIDIDGVRSSKVTIDGLRVFGNSEAGLDLSGSSFSVTSSSIDVINSCFEANGSQGGLLLRDIVGSSVVIGGQVFTNGTPTATATGDPTATADPTPGETSGRGNRIAGNAAWGLRIESSDNAPIDATYNFWGAANGPSGLGSGSGDSVQADGSTVLFEPFLTVTPVPPCAQVAPIQQAPPSQVTVTVTKAVAGDAPEGASYAFSLDCIGFDDSFSLAAGESHTSGSFTANTQCSLTETDNGGAASVSGEFSNRLITGSENVTVTNTFPGTPDTPEVLGISISKTLSSAEPAAVGETVTFDVAVGFQGDQLRNVELVDVFEHGVLAFAGASTSGTALSCQTIPNLPDASHSMVVCPLGDAGGGFSVQLRFTALAGTTPGSTVNQASVVNDQDGAGGNAPTTTGPVTANVEIVEVLALAPLGDAPAAASTAWLQGLLVALAIGLAIGVRQATVRA